MRFLGRELTLFQTNLIHSPKNITFLPKNMMFFHKNMMFFSAYFTHFPNIVC